MPPRTRLVRLAVWRGTRTLIAQSAYCRRAARDKPTASSSQKRSNRGSGNGRTLGRARSCGAPPGIRGRPGSTYGEADYELCSELSDMTGARAS